MMLKMKPKFMLVELSLTILSFGWACVLAFSNAKNFAPYSEMFQLHSVAQWVVIFLVLGIVHLLGMLYQNDQVKIIALMLSILAWSFSTIIAVLNMCRSGVVDTSFIMYAIFTGQSMWLFVKLYVRVRTKVRT